MRSAVKLLAVRSVNKILMSRSVKIPELRLCSVDMYGNVELSYEFATCCSIDHSVWTLSVLACLCYQKHGKGGSMGPFCMDFLIIKVNEANLSLPLNKYFVMKTYGGVDT
jgi:hypothetical protein